ncbi:hypothetical protein BJX99DRAFT_19779 [Aspergillus californicus]
MDCSLRLSIVTFCVASLGPAFNDIHANTFISSPRRSHRYLAYTAGAWLVLWSQQRFLLLMSSQSGIYFMFPLGIEIIKLAQIAIFFRDGFHVGSKIKQNVELHSAQTTREIFPWVEIKKTVSTPSV